MSTDATRNRCLKVALQVCRLIATEALTLNEIAERLGCNHRTVRRYIYAIRDAGIDVQIVSAADLDQDLASTHVQLSPAHRYRLETGAWAGALWLPSD